MLDIWSLLMASGVVSKEILQIQFLQLHLNFSMSYFSRTQTSQFRAH